VNSQILFLPVSPRVKKKRKKPLAPTQSFSFHIRPKSALFIPVGRSQPGREKGKADSTWGSKAADPRGEFSL